MCLESLVAIMALIAACTLDPGVYLSMNIKGDPSATIAKVQAAGFNADREQIDQLATQLGEKTLFGRAGGAATLAVGMAQIFSRAVTGRGLDLWYHFAIMFEALFILTTMDAGTRVGRYLLQDAMGHLWKPLGQTRNLGANLLASALMVAAWGYFLVQGVRDPLGGINSLWPLFGIANQMLAAIALCLATTVILKMQLARASAATPAGEKPAQARPSSPFLAMICGAPLAWLLAVTMTAGFQKIADKDPGIGFLAQAAKLEAARPALEQALEAARAAGPAQAMAAAQNALRTNRTLHFNNILDAIVAAVLLSLTASVVVLSLHQWWLLLSRKRAPQLLESTPVWRQISESGRSGGPRLATVLPVAIALLKELSSESSMERAREASKVCKCEPGAADYENGARATKTEKEIYIEATERRFNGVTRCC
jgi:carbon starvation protein